MKSGIDPGLLDGYPVPVNSEHAGSADGIEAPAHVQVHADEGAALLHRHLRLPGHLLVFEASVLADEHEVGACHVDALTAASLDVGFVVGVQCLLKLAVAEVEIEVLIRLPGGHEAIAMQVRAAEADEGAGEEHVRMSQPAVGTYYCEAIF